MQQRSVAYLSSLLPTHDGKTVFVVSHAGVIRGLISHYLGLEYACCLKHGIPFGYIGDFRFDTQRCQRYAELGKPSGFAQSGAIELPWSAD